MHGNLAREKEDPQMSTLSWSWAEQQKVNRKKKHHELCVHACIIGLQIYISGMVCRYIYQG